MGRFTLAKAIPNLYPLTLFLWLAHAPKPAPTTKHFGISFALAMKMRLPDYIKIMFKLFTTTALILLQTAR